MQLIPYRPFQLDGSLKVDKAWANGAQNVLLVEPTGAGKTVISANKMAEHDNPCCAIAHRRELVSQISLGLARNKIKHRIIGPGAVIKSVVNHQMLELGKSYYDPNAHYGVAGVDTLVRRTNEFERWLKSVTMWMQDEGHHILKVNKWGKAAAMFPNAKKGLAVTATPCRADGKGLGRHADGLIDVMIEGPTMRELINWGYLTDYRVFAPKTEDFNRAGIKVGANGDFTQDSATKAVRKSHIIGNIVRDYKRYASGKLGITFVTDIKTAIDVAAEFNAAGVPAEVVHANTPVSERIAILRKFKNRELLQLVNVDLFGEGFDLPSLEVVSMARPTQSLALFMQQFGRALRIMVSDILNASWGSYTDAQRLKFIAESVKPYAIIIDHVGNIDTTQGGHGLPDSPHTWTLNRRGKREKKQDDDVIPTRTCTSCIQIYERIHKICPWCGFAPEPASRSGPEFVDGDLTELDAATLAAMRGEVAHVDMSPEDYGKELADKGSPRLWVGANVKRHIAKQGMQSALRLSMAWWAGYQRKVGISDDESQRRFYFMFGIDALSAKALKAKDAIVLADKINTKLGELSNYGR